MSHWQNEDDIKAELRTLTEELRQLREELRSMVTPPKSKPMRPFLHRQSWPAPPPEQPVAQAADTPDKPPRRRQKK